jgi:hypothetical protein
MGTCGAALRLVATLAAAFGLALPGDFRLLAALGVAFFEDFRAAAFFLAGACRFADGFEDARRPDRAFEAFRADFAGAARLVALRLAIASVLSEP